MSINDISRRAVLKATAALLGSKSITGMLPNLLEPNTYSVAITWNNAILQAIEAARPGVTIVARALALVHTCMFDAWAAYDARACGTHYGRMLYRPLAEQTQANKETTISYAAYYALINLFPAQVGIFNAVMQQLGYAINTTTIDIHTPAGIGNLAATAVMADRHHDGANQLGDLHAGAYSDYTGYTALNDPDHINDPNHWQPLRVPDGKGGFVIQKYVTPQWGHVRPFALLSPAQFRPPASPAVYPSDLYLQQANQLLDISATLTDTQKTIAEYWEDGAGSVQPPGHWCQIAQYVMKRDMYNLDNAVKLFFILTNALFDASIACWDAKRAYDSERPITAIHYLFKDVQIQAWGGPHQGTQLMLGQNWLPYQYYTILTPSFPEYCSGHSTYSAAAATILNLFSGSDYFGASYTKSAGSSTFEPGSVPASDITLSWPTFTSAAVQAGMSRRYGGIHFEQGDLTGRNLGKCLAPWVWSKAQRYIEGFSS